MRLTPLAKKALVDLQLTEGSITYMAMDARCRPMRELESHGLVSSGKAGVYVTFTLTPVGDALPVKIDSF
jgi:predicted MarR family transcription regulator